MERTLRAYIENEPEVMMRVTALLKRKGYSMRKILMEADELKSGAWLNITLADEGPTFTVAMNTVGKVVDVHTVEEI
ncbi:MAG: hypothetical protein IBX70_07130 [Clostridia bacterium]|nr:hypothetical protein [Clostridia bacterium]